MVLILFFFKYIFNDICDTKNKILKTIRMESYEPRYMFQKEDFQSLMIYYFFIFF